MRIRRRRSRARPGLSRLFLLALGTASLFLYARADAVGAALRAAAERLPGAWEAPTIPESAPPLQENGAVPDSSAEAPEDAALPVSVDLPPLREESAPYVPAIRNDTSFVPDLSSLGENPVALTGTDEPQVLILHTHTSEAYMPDADHYYVQDDNDRTLDSRYNVVAVGDLMEERLAAAGIRAVHDRTVNDYPSYNGSYSRALKRTASALDEHPTIRVVLDVHRDAMIYPDGSRFAPCAEIGGERAAQVMLVVGTDEGGLAHEHWQENLAFAAALQQAADELYPELMRPINLRSSRFNQHVSPGALIVEVGSSGNTLPEALRGAALFTDALIEALR